METVALIIIAILAIAYITFMVIMSIAAFPFGIIPLLGLLACGLFFAKALGEKLNNKKTKNTTIRLNHDCNNSKRNTRISLNLIGPVF